MEPAKLPKPPEQPELPKPEEKLLRAPTFSEKYGWLKSILIVTILVVLVDLGVYSLLRTENNTQILPPSPNTITQNTPPPTTQPTTDSMDNWKTYSTPTGNLTFKYPSTNTIKQPNPTDPTTIQIIPTSPNTKSAANFTITISQKPIAKNQTLAQLIDQNKTCATITSQNGTPSTINGQQVARTYIDTTCGQPTTTIIYTQKDTTFYTISIQTPTQFNNSKPQVDQLLSTLKFY